MLAAVPAWLMRQAYHVFILFGVGSDWLFGSAGVGDFPGFSQKLILVLAFPADIEWGWGPKISQPPGEVNTKNYQNDFSRG